MQKIGILSIYYKNYNFGGMLQSYALCKFLINNGYKAEQICLDFTYDDFRIEQIRKHHGIKKIRALLSFVKYKVLEVQKKINNISISDGLQSRKSKFELFENEIPHSFKVYTINNIAETNEIYDFFICGSDVIWNCGMPASIAALGFTNKKKIAYAPSVGSSNIPEWWFDEYLKYLKKFCSLSMREQSTSIQLENEIGFNVECVADPTFLLNIEQWKEICTDSLQKKECFCYLLGDSIEQRRKIESISKEMGLILVTEPHSTEQAFQKCDKNFGDLKDYQSGPREFLGHIKNADVIFTDSFHACVFAIIFNKEFYALPRLKGSNNSLSGRIKNLLVSFGLEERYIENLDLFERFTTNYENINNTLQVIRKKSSNYLLRGLKDES